MINNIVLNETDKYEVSKYIDWTTVFQVSLLMKS